MSICKRAHSPFLKDVLKDVHAQRKEGRKEGRSSWGELTLVKNAQ
jgi:hypothetical protein